MTAAQRRATASRMGTGMGASRMGTGASQMSDMKEALTETLVKKMRAKFGADDIAVQDIIGEEVVSFMMTTGSVKEDDISGLEGRIRDRIMGQKVAGRRFKGPVVDEWADISKWQVEENERIEAEKLARYKVSQTKMKAELDAQVVEKEMKKVAEIEAKKLYKAEEEAQLEVWKQEELEKIKQKAVAIDKLKLDRQAQLEDKERRRQAQLEVKRKEEEDLRKQLAAEHRRKVAEEAANKQRIAEELERLKASNAATLKLRAAQAAADAALEIKYQELYAEKLAKQEAAYEANLIKMKEKQKHQEAFGNAIGPYKRYMPDEIIEKNFAEYERKADERERRDAQKIVDGNLEMRRAIAEQVKSKQERLDRERAEESKRHERFAKVVNTLEEVEKEAGKEGRIKATYHRGELEAQMRDNLVRKQVFPMTDIEKSLNADMLRKVAATTTKNANAATGGSLGGVSVKATAQ